MPQVSKITDEITSVPQIQESIERTMNQICQTQKMLQQQLDDVQHEMSSLAINVRTLNNDENEEGEKGHINQIHAYPISLELPKFDGTNPNAWLFKADKFFRFYPSTTVRERLLIAALHMDGHALIWFQFAEKLGQFTSWKAFHKALVTRFGPLDDPVGALTKLQQDDTTTVEDYLTQFEALACRVHGFDGRFMTSCFISGLKVEIRLAIRMFEPETICEAFRLARLQERILSLGYEHEEKHSSSG